MDLQADHDLSERTVDGDGVVYIKGNYIQIAYDGNDTVETFTYLRPADAQQAFDNLTQGWYQKGPRANNPYDRDLRRKRQQKRCHRCGEWQTELFLVPEKYYDLVSSPNQFALCGKCEKDKGLEDWLREKQSNPASPLDKKSPRELQHGFNAFITPDGEWLQIPADGTTHYEFAVDKLGFNDLNDALKNFFIRVSFSPKGSTFIQVEDLKTSLPLIQAAMKPLYEKYGSIHVFIEDWNDSFATDLGYVVMANKVSDLKKENPYGLERNPINYRKEISVKMTSRDPYRFQAYTRHGKPIGNVEVDRQECYQKAKEILVAEDAEEARKAGY